MKLSRLEELLKPFRCDDDVEVYPINEDLYCLQITSQTEGYTVQILFVSETKGEGF